LNHLHHHGKDLPHLALAAALVYALAYTLELGLSMVVYFGGGR